MLSCQKEYVLMFLAAIFHEMGHLLIILKYKIKVDKIKIMPYGIAIKTEVIKNPTEEILVCIAGPAVNFLLFFAFKKYLFFSLCNIVIFVLNLIPALPLDGGCILKAYLSKRYGYINAIKKLIDLTKIMGVVVVFFGMLILIITKYKRCSQTRKILLALFCFCSFYSKHLMECMD